VLPCDGSSFCDGGRWSRSQGSRCHSYDSPRSEVSPPSLPYSLTRKTNPLLSTLLFPSMRQTKRWIHGRMWRERRNPGPPRTSTIGIAKGGARRSETRTTMGPLGQKVRTGWMDRPLPGFNKRMSKERERRNMKSFPSFVPVGQARRQRGSHGMLIIPALPEARGN